MTHFLCTPHHRRTWQPYLNKVALLSGWTRNKKSWHQKGQSEAKLGLWEGRIRERQTQTQNTAGSVTRELGDRGNLPGCPLVGIVAKGKKREHSGHRKVQRRDNGKTHSVGWPPAVTASSHCRTLPLRTCCPFLFQQAQVVLSHPYKGKLCKQSMLWMNI